MTSLNAAVLRSTCDNAECASNDKRIIRLRALQESVNSRIDEQIIEVLNKRTTTESRDGMAHEIVRFDETRREWEAVFVPVWSGAKLVDIAIDCGFYLRAMCLIRQEVEGLAQLHHIRNKSRKPKRAPGLAVLRLSVRKWYDDLSDGAHLASHELVGHIVPADPMGLQREVAVLPQGTSVFPIANPYVGRAVLRLHLRVRIGLLREMRAYVAEIQDQDSRNLG